MEHKELLFQCSQDPAFAKWVDEVSPPAHGVQPVFFAELFLILQILWEVYSWMKALGWFDKWLAKQRVKAAMRKKTRAEQERALAAVKARYGIA